jgi:hypothetical protein
VRSEYLGDARRCYRNKCGDNEVVRKQKVLERTSLPTFLTLLNNTVSVALFNYGKLRTLVFLIVSVVHIDGVGRCL